MTNKAKTLVKHIPCDCKCNVIQIKNRMQIYASVSVKIIVKYYNWSPSTCICENGMYWKSIVDTVVAVCDEIINDNVSANVTILCQQMRQMWQILYQQMLRVLCQQIFMTKK